MPVRRRKDISEELKKAVLSHIQAGLPYRQISALTGLSVGAISSLKKVSLITIFRWFKSCFCYLHRIYQDMYHFRWLNMLLYIFVFQKHAETGSVASSRKNCGRKKKLTPRHLRVIEIALRRSPTKSSRKLKMELQNTGVNIGASTLRRYLKKMGLVSRFAARKPLLTRRHRALRLAFAKKYVKKPQEFWANVLFTDETRIAIRNDCSRTRLRRKNGERLHFITPTVKHPPAVMLWGSFSAKGVGRIRFLEKGEMCNSAWYLKVLNQQVKWSARSLFAGEFFLQDDGAPCHRSKVVKDFVRQQGWSTLDWPPQSPDLNPIENLWSLLKKKIWTHNFNSTMELKARIIAVWNHGLDKELLEKLSYSMTDRLEAVIKARGGPTKY